MKRDENLHPLSWEHHQGLVIARRIRRQLAEGTPCHLVATYARTMWREHLQPHFETEEELLLPLMEQYQADEPLIRRVRDDHSRFREWIGQIETDADEETLSLFANRLTDHIRFEENELFPHAERVLPQAALRTLGEQLHARYEAKPTS